MATRWARVHKERAMKRVVLKKWFHHFLSTTPTRVLSSYLFLMLWLVQIDGLGILSSRGTSGCASAIAVP